MSKVRISSALAAVCLALVNSSIVCADMGSDRAVESFLACVAMTNDAKRLTCYDQQASALASAMGSASRDKTEEDIVSVGAPPTSPNSADDISIYTPPATTADNFGAPTNREGELTEIVVTVAHIRKRAYGQLVLTFENGQVWTEKHAVKGIRIKTGDTLTIRRGAFGGYRLVMRNNRSSVVTRVE